MQGLSAQEMKPQISNKNSVHCREVKDIDTRFFVSGFNHQQVPLGLPVWNLIDRWAKNKHMFHFPDTWFIFNLHTRNIFLLYRIHKYYISNIQGMHELIEWKETPYLEFRLFVHVSESPSLLVPCSKPTAPFETSPPFVALPSPNALFTPTRCLFPYRWH